MKFADIKRHVDNFLADPRILNEMETNIIKESFNSLSSDIHKLVDGEKLEHNNETFNNILSCSLLLGNKVLNAPIDDKFSAMAISFSELLYNWNANTFKDDVLKQHCLFISRMIELRNLMLKTTNIIKEVDNRNKDLASWSPPAYEIAKDYLLNLLEENEGKE